MNEAIKEIADQAGITESNLSDGNMSYTDLERFAELVRQSTIEQITVVSTGHEVVAVTLTDEEHRILKVIWEKS